MRTRLVALLAAAGLAAGALSVATAVPAGAVTSRCDQPNALPLRSGQSLAYVQEVYRALFDREADAAGAFYWASRLDDGMLRIGFTCYFTHHPEFLEDWVDVSYQTYLGRTPDLAGRDFFVAELQAGRMDSQYVDIGILGSEEYFQRAGGTNRAYLTAIYRDVLGRAPDQQGLDYWTSRLDGGTPRWVVGQLVMYSQENATNWVRHFLNEHVSGDHSDDDVFGWVLVHASNGYDLIVTLAEILASATGIDGGSGGGGSGGGSMPPDTISGGGGLPSP